MSTTEKRLELKPDWWFYGVGAGLFLALGLHGFERRNVILLVLLLAVVLRVLWVQIERRGFSITSDGVYQPRLFRAPVRIGWAEVQRVHYRRGLLTIQGSAKEIVINQHVYRNREDLVDFIRAHLPPSLVIPRTWWERWTGAA